MFGLATNLVLLCALLGRRIATAAKPETPACSCYDVRNNQIFGGGEVPRCRKPLGRITATKTFNEAMLDYTNGSGKSDFPCGQSPSERFSHVCCDECTERGCQTVRSDDSGQVYDDPSRFPEQFADFDKQYPSSRRIPHDKEEEPDSTEDGRPDPKSLTRPSQSRKPNSSGAGTSSDSAQESTEDAHTTKSQVQATSSPVPKKPSASSTPSSNSKVAPDPSRATSLQEAGQAFKSGVSSTRKPAKGNESGSSPSNTKDPNATARTSNSTTADTATATAENKASSSQTGEKGSTTSSSSVASTRPSKEGKPAAATAQDSAIYSAFVTTLPATSQDQNGATSPSQQVYSVIQGDNAVLEQVREPTASGSGAAFEEAVSYEYSGTGKVVSWGRYVAVGQVILATLAVSMFSGW